MESRDGKGEMDRSMPALVVIFRVVWKERRRRVLCPARLRKGSPGEFRCTQRLPLGALFDGLNLCPTGSPQVVGGQ